MLALFGKCSSSLLWNLTYRNDLACANPYNNTGSTAHGMVSIPSQKDFHGTLFHVAFHGAAEQPTFTAVFVHLLQSYYKPSEIDKQWIIVHPVNQCKMDLQGYIFYRTIVSFIRVLNSMMLTSNLIRKKCLCKQTDLYSFRKFASEVTGICKTNNCCWSFVLDDLLIWKQNRPKMIVWPLHYAAIPI